MNNAHRSWFAGTLFVTLAAVMVASPALAVPPDPNNAALLYYQSFLTLAQLDDDARDRIAKVARGDKTPDKQAREDIGKCAGAIEFAQAAVKLPACDWGVRYSRGFEALMPQMAQMRALTFVLIADARILAADGDNKGALERCLMAGTFARHVGDDTVISYLVSIGVRDLEYKAIQDIVGRSAGNAELLQWLKDELAESDVVTLSPARSLKNEMEIVDELLQRDNVEKLARAIAGTDAKKAAVIVRKADEKLLERARGMYAERMSSALTIFSTPLPYEQAVAQLKQVADFDPNDPSSQIVQAFVPGLDKIFSQKTAIETHANALTGGIEILLSRAKTGKLPDTLPPGLPKDAFSSKDFEYAKSKDGFMLRCPGRDLDVYRYEFKIKK